MKLYWKVNAKAKVCTQHCDLSADIHYVFLAVCRDIEPAVSPAFHEPTRLAEWVFASSRNWYGYQPQAKNPFRAYILPWVNVGQTNCTNKTWTVETVLTVCSYALEGYFLVLLFIQLGVYNGLTERDNWETNPFQVTFKLGENMWQVVNVHGDQRKIYQVA